MNPNDDGKHKISNIFDYITSNVTTKIASVKRGKMMMAVKKQAKFSVRNPIYLIYELVRSRNERQVLQVMKILF